jgi:hypothetical protein
MTNSCEKYTLTDNPLSAADSVKFSTDIKPIFSSCVGCHDGSRSPNLNVNPYQSLKDGGFINVAQPSQSLLYVQLKTKTSHKTLVSPTELQKILQWITQGAKNN